MDNIYNGSPLGEFLFQTFKVLPAVYDESLSYLELLGKVASNLNEDRTVINSMGDSLTAFQSYVVSQLNAFNSTVQQEILDEIDLLISNGTLSNLLMYKPPTVTLTIQPSQTVYNKGESINSVILSASSIKGSANLSVLKFYKNGVLINSINTGIDTVETTIDANVINSDCTYYATLSDGINTIQSNTININFVNNFYMGVIDPTAQLTETLIKSLSSMKVAKQNIDTSFTTSNQSFVFAYPSSYGNLTSISDGMFNLVNSFILSTITVNGEQYNVYEFNSPTTISNYTLHFQF